MAELQIHELSTIVNPVSTNFLVVSDGSITYKMALSQWKYDLPGRTTADPAVTAGSLRYAQYDPATTLGYNPSSLGRSGPTWNDGTSDLSLLDARDRNRIPWRRLLSATSATYTLTAADVNYGILIHFRGTQAKTVTVPVMATDVMPTTALPAHGLVGVSRRVEIRQSDIGAITLVAGAGMTLTGTLVSNGDNTSFVIDYLTNNTAQARLVAA